jgi:hypothetical protein
LRCIEREATPIPLREADVRADKKSCKAAEEIQILWKKPPAQEVSMEELLLINAVLDELINEMAATNAPAVMQKEKSI